MKKSQIIFSSQWSKVAQAYYDYETNTIQITKDRKWKYGARKNNRTSNRTK